MYHKLHNYLNCKRFSSFCQTVTLYKIVKLYIKWKVSEIVVLKSTQKGLPAPDSDASYNCGFSKGKWPSASHHDGAAFTLPSMCTKSHARMAWLTRTSCSRYPCASTTFQENLTVSAASTPGGAVLFCWVMKNILII